MPHVPVMIYHKIDRPGPGARLRGAFTPPERFERQMRFLKKRGFTFTTASALIEHFREHGSFPVKSIAVTFDDGWLDNYTNAFPILERLDVKATIFLVPSCLGQTTAKVVGDGEPPRAHMTREQVLEMSKYGIEFGSHTLNHRPLNQVSGTELRSEVVEAKAQIEDLVQKPCKVFAYPAGFCTDEAKQVVEGAGHIAAFSSTYGPADPLDLYALNRTEILHRDRFLFQFGRKLEHLRVPVRP
jgi:peptidoglycan/xylan/chitin deacetylase (PgdA/CDA1 family)